MGKGGARKATPLDKEKALREEAEASLAASELKAAQFEAEATTAKAAVQAAKAQAMDFAARVAKLVRRPPSVRVYVNVVGARGYRKGGGAGRRIRRGRRPHGSFRGAGRRLCRQGAVFEHADGER
mmetsp:Transcript_16545/g.55870  ORF Transcript_16545/g.55870 Transcript_16545/m.55870 type:complete len:125 (-) Transcript_16545:937-1311(-)